jgi:hypothetical protein
MPSRREERDAELLRRLRTETDLEIPEGTEIHLIRRTAATRSQNTWA